jgi:hypothetical protein
MDSSRSCSSREVSGSTNENIGGAGLATEARREAGIAARQRLAGEDLAGVQRRQGDLGGAGQVEVVGGQVVDLLLGVGQEAGAVERLLADEDGRDHRLEALGREVVHRPRHQRELQPRQVAAQVGEARPRQPRAALHVDALAGQLEVVAHRPARHPRLADLLDDRVLGRGGRVGQIGQLGQRRRQLGVDLAELLGERLGLAGDLAHLGDRRVGALAGLLGLGDRLVGGVLLGAQALQAGQDLALADVERQDAVQDADIGVAAAGQGGAHGVGVATDQPKIEHGAGEYPARSASCGRSWMCRGRRTS